MNNTQRIYYSITSMDTSGHVTEEMLGNGLLTSRVYDSVDGELEAIYTSSPDGSYVAQNLLMQYDAVGNLDMRTDGRRNQYENYCYDDLNRLTGSAVDANCSDGDITYDSYGNITYKKGVGSYSYGNGNTTATDTAGPHAVVATSVNTVTYRYDANGNMTSDRRNKRGRNKRGQIYF